MRRVVESKSFAAWTMWVGQRVQLPQPRSNRDQRAWELNAGFGITFVLWRVRLPCTCSQCCSAEQSAYHYFGGWYICEQSLPAMLYLFGLPASRRPNSMTVLALLAPDCRIALTELLHFLILLSRLCAALAWTAATKPDVVVCCIYIHVPI